VTSGGVRRTTRRAAVLLAALALGAWSGGKGPYDIPLRPGPKVPGARGSARLLFADSPFGVAVTQDGRHSYDIRITASGLPDPATLGAFRAFVAWEVSTDLTEWHRLGAVGNGTTTVGGAEWNKFLLVITAEPDSAPLAHSGPTVLHGNSPSGWLQRFLSHPLFRGVSQ
jgi:hypothetical protein